MPVADTADRPGRSQARVYLGLVERIAAGAVCKYEQQSARDRQIAHEMNLLIHDLVGGNAPVRMKDERRGECVSGIVVM